MYTVMMKMMMIPQSCSSDMSPQSLSASQTNDAGIQRELLHVNSVGEHVGRAATHANTPGSHDAQSST